MALEQETFDSVNRVRAIEKRNQLLRQIEVHEAALTPLKQELSLVTTQLMESLVKNRYEPPTIARFNPEYGQTDSPIDYMPQQGPIRRIVNRVVSRVTHL